MSVRLTALADSFVTALNNAPGGTWSDLTVGEDPGDFVRAYPCLDPANLFESENVGLYVIPVTMLYNREGSQGRRQVIQLNKGPVIAIVISYRFQDQDYSGLDVSSWEAVKQILNLREDVDDYLSKYDWGQRIQSITAEPPQEIPLKGRMFLSVTEYEFEAMSC